MPKPTREAACLAELVYEDLDRNHDFHVFSDGRIIVFRRSQIEVWKELRERLAVLPISVGFGEFWHLDSSESSLAISRNGQRLEVWDLASAEPITFPSAPIHRPASIPTRQMTFQSRPRASAAIWQWENARFAHTGDGRRGWVTPIRLSDDGKFAVIPCESSAALVQLGAETRVVQQVAFEGRMRASCVTDREMLVVNSKGKMFRSPLRLGTP